MRSPVLPLTWHLARSSGRRGLQSQLLAAGAAAVGAFVLLVMVAAALGSGTRADRTAWRTPEPARHGTAVQAIATTYVVLARQPDGRWLVTTDTPELPEGDD